MYFTTQFGLVTFSVHSKHMKVVVILTECNLCWQGGMVFGGKNFIAKQRLEDKGARLENKVFKGIHLTL